jgi:hypothetical protein
MRKSTKLDERLRINKWGYVSYTQIGRHNVVKMAAPPSWIYGFNTVSSVSYFMNFNKLILKFIWTGKRLGRANKTLKRKNQKTDTIQLQD